MFDKMKQLMEMKEQVARIKKELETTTVDVAPVSGIKVVISGAQRFQSIDIDNQCIQENNKQKLESDLLQTMNAAIQQSQQLAAQKMQDVMPGLPGL